MGNAYLVLNLSFVEAKIGITSEEVNLGETTALIEMTVSDLNDLDCSYKVSIYLSANETRSQLISTNFDRSNLRVIQP